MLMRTAFIAASLAISFAAVAQPERALYDGAIPNAIDAPDDEAVRDPKEQYPFLMNISRPTITPHLPKTPDANRAAVIILPGGSYKGVSIVKEGHAVAEQFNKMGIAAFVVKYRTPSPTHMLDRTVGPLQDAQQAIHLVREHASEWNIDPNRIGLMGFSAGGHLAATAATHFDKPVLKEWEGSSLRPDFVMLIYPVISMTIEIGHEGSRQMLLGDAPSPESIREFSNELAVTDKTPPTFLVHAASDPYVPVANSLRYFEALNAHKIPAELMVYPDGGHGFGLHNATTTDAWIDRCRQWLVSQKILSRDLAVK
jgi:acetyl esterase/lipase